MLYLPNWPTYLSVGIFLFVAVTCFEYYQSCRILQPAFSHENRKILKNSSWLGIIVGFYWPIILLIIVVLGGSYLFYETTRAFITLIHDNAKNDRKENE